MSHGTAKHPIEGIRGMAQITQKIVGVGPKIPVRFFTEAQIKIIDEMPDFT